MSDILGRGVYSLRDAAKLTGLKPRRVREWFLGRKAEPDRSRVFQPDFEPIGTVHAISFLDLVDLYVAGHLREHGVSMPTVRKVYAKLRSDYNTPHPFARKELLTDGQSVFVRGIDKAGEEEIYDALTKQKVFPEIILPFLRQIDYDRSSSLATRWHIATGVVVDPGKNFGRPVLERLCIPTYVIAAEYAANGRNLDRVAGWYNLTSDEVLAAVRFETGLAA
jgi:uncharacterized protein (DUF433 family)